MTEPAARPAPLIDEEAPLATSTAEERISVATQWQLMWWRFKKHRLAMASTVVVLLFYLVVIFADFLAYSDPLASEAQRSLLPPQRIHWFDEGRFSPLRLRPHRHARPEHLQARLHPGPQQEDPRPLLRAGVRIPPLA